MDMSGDSVTYYESEKMFHGNIPLIMGTKLDMLVIGKSKYDATTLWQNAVDRLKEIERIADRFSPDSEVAVINRAEPLSRVWVSPELHRMIDLCADYKVRTLGIFDVTLGRTPFPSFDSDDALIIPNNGCYLDFGGFAKGYGLSVVTEILKSSGVTTAYIDFGNSSIMALGTHPYGDCWSVSIPDPFTSKEIRQMHLHDAALSISGNTPVYNTHIVNPIIGRWESGNKISAIVAPDALDAEVLSTTWMIADETQRRNIIENFDLYDEFVYMDDAGLPIN